MLGIQIPLFPEKLFLPTEPSPSPDTVTVEQGYEPHRSEPLRVSPKSLLSCPSADLRMELSATENTLGCSPLSHTELGERDAGLEHKFRGEGYPQTL